MSPAGGLVGPPVAPGVDPPPELEPQPPQQQDGVNRDGAEWGTFRNPCLDLFLADGRTPKQRLRDVLADAWKHDAELTLKLICQLRGVRGTGKGDREGFYTAALWMHQAHPQTLVANLSTFAELGYIKDLPELLFRLVKGPDVRELEKAKAEAWKAAAKAKAAAEAPVVFTQSSGRKRARDDPAPPPRAVDEAGRSKKVAMDAARALSMYKNDDKYKNLFDGVAEFFASRLKSDLEMLRDGNKNKIGLAAKWCPSVGSSFDRATLLCEAIARRLFPWDDTSEGDDRKKAYLALRRLRREVLVPLRQVLGLPEVYMSKQQWGNLPYHRVAKLAMERYEQQFIKHDGQRFMEFMDLRSARSYGPNRPSGGGSGSVVSSSWRALTEDAKKNGLFHRCAAVCDLSDSMEGQAREVCLGMGLLLAEVATPTACNHTVRLFGMHPYSYTIRETSWDKRMAELNDLGPRCDDKIDLMVVFDNILNGATQLGLGCEEMIRTIFVFTNKEFNKSVVRPWRSDYKTVCENFQDCGFGSVVPQVVFWNLGGRRSGALTEAKDGVMKLCGFSDTFFRQFLENGGIVTPDDEMYGSIASEHYNGLLVID